MDFGRLFALFEGDFNSVVKWCQVCFMNFIVLLVTISACTLLGILSRESTEKKDARR